jgi:hypothetical protein
MSVFPSVIDQILVQLLNPLLSLNIPISRFSI